MYHGEGLYFLYDTCSSEFVRLTKKDKVGGIPGTNIFISFVFNACESLGGSQRF